MTKLTDQSIRSLQVPEGASCPGSGSANSPAARRPFSSSTASATQQRRKTLGSWVPGTLPPIRKEAAVVLAQARLGKDVVGETRKAQQEAANAARC